MPNKRLQSQLEASLRLPAIQKHRRVNASNFPECVFHGLNCNGWVSISNLGDGRGPFGILLEAIWSPFAIMVCGSSHDAEGDAVIDTF